MNADSIYYLGKRHLLKYAFLLVNLGFKKLIYTSRFDDA